MEKTKITEVTTLQGVTVHKRIKDGRTDYILSRQLPDKNGNIRRQYLVKFDPAKKQPVIMSYTTQHEAETAAIYAR